MRGRILNDDEMRCMSSATMLKADEAANVSVGTRKVAVPISGTGELPLWADLVLEDNSQIESFSFARRESKLM
jgi:hypothetical protein